MWDIKKIYDTELVFSRVCLVLCTNKFRRCQCWCWRILKGIFAIRALTEVLQHCEPWPPFCAVPQTRPSNDLPPWPPHPPLQSIDQLREGGFERDAPVADSKNTALHSHVSFCVCITGIPFSPLYHEDGLMMRHRCLSGVWGMSGRYLGLSGGCLVMSWRCPGDNEKRNPDRALEGNWRMDWRMSYIFKT